jgi:hypothetical protein
MLAIGGIGGQCPRQLSSLVMRIVQATRDGRPKLGRSLLALLLVAILADCQASDTVPMVIAPVPTDVVGLSGSWSVLSRPARPLFDQPPSPLDPEAAAKSGAKAGVVAPLMPAAVIGEGMEGADEDSAAVGMILFLPLLAVGTVLAPISALVGAGVGAAKAHSEAEIAAAEVSIKNALEGWEPARMLRLRLVERGSNSTNRRIVDCGTTTSAADCLARSPDDTTVLLTVEMGQPGFAIQGSIEPQVGLFLTARVRLLRVSDGREVFCRSWLFRGVAEPYFELAANEADRLRSAFETANEALATTIIDVVMLAGTVEVRSQEPQKPGTVRTLEPDC